MFGSRVSQMYKHMWQVKGSSSEAHLRYAVQIENLSELHQNWLLEAVRPGGMNKELLVRQS